MATRLMPSPPGSVTLAGCLRQSVSGRPTAFGWQPTNAAANIRDQGAVAASTIEVLRTESIGGGGFAAEGAVRLPIRASGAAGSISHRLF